MTLVLVTVYVVSVTVTVVAAIAATSRFAVFNTESGTPGEPPRPGGRQASPMQIVGAGSGTVNDLVVK